MRASWMEELCHLVLLPSHPHRRHLRREIPMLCHRHHQPGITSLSRGQRAKSKVRGGIGLRAPTARFLSRWTSTSRPRARHFTPRRQSLSFAGTLLRQSRSRTMAYAQKGSESCGKNSLPPSRTSCCSSGCPIFTSQPLLFDKTRTKFKLGSLPSPSPSPSPSPF